ncbi:putative methyltransferase TARBP1 [Lamellibrachia satsuma]|nr:putative methyltransferase TARBP1 [Lamellibrachia satsuma]
MHITVVAVLHVEIDEDVEDVESGGTAVYTVVIQEKLDVFWQYLIEMLSQEAQPSIRCLTEWLIVRALHRRGSLLDYVWSAMLQCTDKKAAFLCSLLTILGQVSKTTQDHDMQTEFCLVAIPRIMPWCSSHHFNLRVCAQAALITLWTLCKQNELELVLTRYCLIESIMEFGEENSSAQRNTEKLLDNFFFKFHSVRDYSIETIVHTLPCLTLVTEAEWLDPRLFSEMDPCWQVEGAHILPLRSQSEELKQSKPGAWRVKVSDQEEDQQMNLDGDVQKKMIPWSAMLPQLEERDSGEEVTQQQRPGAGELILVTSLIDKIPNLGGLCRTCEIFGVSEFVIANLMYVADKMFQSLSVTAHKWLPIREVKEHALKEYLQHMKGEGYTLVGVEQTAHSKCLTQYEFPKKTLLLLGNEKEGIPVNLIQLLDVCVEIPQQGVIRSLNVHVSGALLIWEYTRQQLSANAKCGPE